MGTPKSAQSKADLGGLFKVAQYSNEAGGYRVYRDVASHQGESAISTHCEATFVHESSARHYAAWRNQQARDNGTDEQFWIE
ncbi:hypothetical protein [Pseudomonas chlororaphis]|uniref:hypothetical protein n=1 Tax=Pseudomonas chlororaphis TaxID=587753 RepID=UPI0005F898C4|nr:hypothetical protein [Pseudomonas chlororaphis]